MTLYPSLPEVLAAHARLIVLFGGTQGIRDQGALEAALAGPQSGHYRDIILEHLEPWLRQHVHLLP